MKLRTFLLTALILLPVAAPRAQGPSPRKPEDAEKPCNFLTQAEAEAILGMPVVSRRDGDYECSFVQTGYTGGMGPGSKRVSLNIWRYSSPVPDDVTARRRDIAQRRPAPAAVRDVANFADAAIWTWTPGWGGTFNVFKGGTIEVGVDIIGIGEDAAMQHARTLAARPLGGTAKTDYVYAGASPGSGQAPSVTAAQSPAAYAATWMGQNKVVRGTVSRVSVDFKGSPQWLTIYLKESPAGVFVVCSPYPGMFQQTVGDLYTLVGKTLEVTGQVEAAYCAGQGTAASIRVVDSQHYRVEASPTDKTITRGVVRTVAGVASPSQSTPGRPRVGLDVCNSGKAGFETFVATGTRVQRVELASGDCAHVYEENGAPSASVGFGFADTKGQWGAPRRLDSLPAFYGSANAPTEVWSAADQNVTVKRGTTDVVLPMKLRFHPPSPGCRPDTSTAAERDYRRSMGLPVGGASCDSWDYTLNVVAYAETREVAFEKKCFNCPEPKTVPLSPEQRRLGQQAVGQMAAASSIAAGFIGLAEQKSLQDSLEGPREFQPMNWDALRAALSNVRSAGRPAEMPQYLAFHGTVSRVDVSPPQATEHWVNVYFQESPEQAANAYETVYGAFNTCTSRPDIFEDIFGTDFQTRMIGKVLEIEGEYSRAYCKGWKGGVRITLAHQVRSVDGHGLADVKR